MKDNFAACLALVLRYEGGKVDNKKDPGGRTNQGVTQAVYSAWRRGRGLPTRDVYAMESDERNAIYRGNYWNAVSGDSLSKGLDLIVFDIAVNSGPMRAANWLREVGDIGTVGKIHALDARRRAFWRKLASFVTFGRGWFRREDDVMMHALAMANGNH